jgi:hypothetical protein
MKDRRIKKQCHIRIKKISMKVKPNLIGHQLKEHHMMQQDANTPD